MKLTDLLSKSGACTVKNWLMVSMFFGIIMQFLSLG